ncbi:MAG: fibrobacter succinogenes major paralogous domain-containing protein [Flavobacteriales bacterium]|nr:fibrobacter succinogenes major paralogous domain-containing protein [Flavobacteriales bacterium]
MNRILITSWLLSCTVTLHAQGSLNIHRNTGSPPVTQVSMSEIDSVVNQLEPPPAQLRVHRTDGSVQAFPFSIIDSVTYSPAGPEGTGLVATMPPLSVHSMAANCRGYVGDIGDSPVTSRGICYGTEPLPDLGGEFVTASGSAGLFYAWVVGLQPEVTYYARAFVTNAQGTAYGNQTSFMTLPSTPLNEDITYGSVTDQDGNSYATVAIGTQVWMAENLRSSSYANGDPIPNSTEPAGWGWTAPEEGAWCLYNNDPNFDTIIGKLYNWYAVNDPRNICPSGWHVPTELDWQTMELGMGMPVEDLELTGNRGIGEQVGLKLRTTGNQFWIGTMPATNESGFSGIAAGRRNLDGPFVTLVQEAWWWTATDVGGNYARTRSIHNGSAGVDAIHVVYPVGLSVRCVMD